MSNLVNPVEYPRASYPSKLLPSLMSSALKRLLGRKYQSWFAVTPKVLDAINYAIY